MFDGPFTSLIRKMLTQNKRGRMAKAWNRLFRGIYDWNTALKGYNLIKKNKLNRKGERLAMFTKKANVFTEIHKLEHENSVWSIWVRIRGERNSGNLFIGVSCKRPWMRFLDVQIFLKDDIGDFNYPVIG